MLLNLLLKSAKMMKTKLNFQLDGKRFVDCRSGVKWKNGDKRFNTRKNTPKIIAIGFKFQSRIIWYLSIWCVDFCWPYERTFQRSLFSGRLLKTKRRFQWNEKMANDWKRNTYFDLVNARTTKMEQNENCIFSVFRNFRGGGHKMLATRNTVIVSDLVSEILLILWSEP